MTVQSTLFGETFPDDSGGQPLPDAAVINCLRVAVHTKFDDRASEPERLAAGEALSRMAVNPGGPDEQYACTDGSCTAGCEFSGNPMALRSLRVGYYGTDLTRCLDGGGEAGILPSRIS